MSISSNEIFKFVSLRRPLDSLTIDPVADIPSSQVVKYINHSGIKLIDPDNPDPEILNLIANIPILSEEAIGTMRLSEVEYLLREKERLSYSVLSSLELDVNGSLLTLAQFSSTAEFENSYIAVVDSWLVQAFYKKSDALLRRHESIIRAAHICHRLYKCPNSLKGIGVIAKLLTARIVFPKKWRVGRYRHQALLSRHAKYLDNLEAPTQSNYEQELEKKKKEFSTLRNKIHNLERIQSKAFHVYTKYKVEIQISSQNNSTNERAQSEANYSRRFKSGRGIRSSVSAGRLDDRYHTRPESRIAREGREHKIISSVDYAIQLDDRYYNHLESRMTESELQVFNEIFNTASDLPATLYTMLSDIAYELSNLVDNANRLCQEIAEEKPWTTFPLGGSQDESNHCPSVRAIGWGELIVAREHLVGYEAQEIAHIENILGGENKLREHERTRITEELTETESVEETETERDLQTSDRYELQRESQKIIDQEFSIDVGVDTSGRYGLTKVDTFSDASFFQGKSEASSSSLQLAKEVVSRAVEKTFESVRQLRRLTITEQIRELNTHSIENAAPEGATEIPMSRSGIYLWVEKIHEIELRHYGTRLMMEFYVPEPAVSLLEGGMPKKKQDVIKPPPFNIGPVDVSIENYLCLTKQFGAEDIEPPPPSMIQIGWGWASTPNEAEDSPSQGSAGIGSAEDTVNEQIDIPLGYSPVSGVAIASPHPNESVKNKFDLVVAVGGVVVLDIEKGQGSRLITPSEFDMNKTWTWSKPIPVTLRAQGHYDKTLTVQVTIHCMRSPEEYKRWQLKTWERLHEAHRVLMREYERAVEQQEFANVELFQIQGRPATENRRIEREELRKWCVKAMRYPEQFAFDAIESVAGFQETDPLDADAHAPIVMFFEDALEWQQMSYVFYPYFWGRRDTWQFRNHLTNPDPRHNAFLRAGAARVVVPVTPGYEARVLHYLDSVGKSELDRIISSVPTEPDDIPPGSNAEDLWLELLTNYKEDLALGHGTLAVEHGNDLVTINTDDTEATWQVRERDLGRELYIGSYQYTIASLVADNRLQFHLNKPYEGETHTRASYATGSVPYGPPWLVRLPTNLVVLHEGKETLKA